MGTSSFHRIHLSLNSLGTCRASKPWFGYSPRFGQNILGQPVGAYYMYFSMTKSKVCDLGKHAMIRTLSISSLKCYLCFDWLDVKIVSEPRDKSKPWLACPTFGVWLLGFCLFIQIMTCLFLDCKQPKNSAFIKGMIMYLDPLLLLW